MNYRQVTNTCLFNPLYIQYNEDIGRTEYFYYDLEYPIFYNVKNSYFQVNETILNNLNNTIYSSVYTFKDGIFEEEEQINKLNPNQIKKKINYQVYSDYDITFNKNQILSLKLNLYADEGVNSIVYNDLYSYNIDLLTGKQLLLKDIFREGVDYMKLINDYINYTIKQDPTSYYPDAVVEIPEDQAFYLTDTGIYVYFAIDEVSPKEAGIAKFFIEFSKFESYINPRFYCNVQNMESNAQRRRPYPQNPRYYY